MHSEDCNFIQRLKIISTQEKVRASMAIIMLTRAIYVKISVKSFTQDHIHRSDSMCGTDYIAILFFLD